MRPLVSASWLADNLADVRVVDVRWYLDGRSGRDAYTAGHLPGAVWLDIDADLSDPSSTRAGRHPLPSPQRFAAALGRVGIADGMPVVAYDDTGGSTAGRLWWLLHSLGEPAAVLDGGIQAWAGPLDTGDTGDGGDGPVEHTPVERTVRPWPAARFVDADHLAAGPASESSASDPVVFDARTAARYAQGDPAIDPRPGHVPGALSAPWGGNLDGAGRFLPADQLRERFAAAVARPAVAYCGSGVTACHNLLAMTIAGIDDIALYPGSWSQWGADESRPVETG